jgi:alpha-beta hydrolase superfamily lysophospholipase
LLINRIDELKSKLKRPDLKFNIIAHSMGGLIARYAACMEPLICRPVRAASTDVGGRDSHQ